ncbi:recombinase family protein [Occallatibacter savannae]|uniref:recombinase family protein n=1 Tax=Occallatibacter savannae TaxID=1002691 RepID=UPI000D693544|nr:recombinase family protein [Occallatibacter savannae]
MKRVALYLRVSNPTQFLENQSFQLREICSRRGLEIVAEYSDKGISGTKARRPGLDALMRDARKRKFDVVYVAAFDRIARSVRHFLQVLDELESFGVEFCSAREAIDTSGPMGRLFLTIIGSISALEHDLIRDRIKQGMARRRLMGLHVGRQPLDVNHRALVADRLSGMSLTDVAKRYGVSRASVVRWVREAKQMSSVSPTPIQPKHEVREEVAA